MDFRVNSHLILCSVIQSARDIIKEFIKNVTFKFESWKNVLGFLSKNYNFYKDLVQLCWIKKDFADLYILERNYNNNVTCPL